MDREDRTSGDRPPMPSLFLRLSTLVSYILLIIVNYLSNSGILGPTNADISAKFPTPLTPAGYVRCIQAPRGFELLSAVSRHADIGMQKLTE
jgi:hypothetical protein